MAVFKKKRAREMVWGPEEPWVEPKKEIIAGPAADLSSSTGSSGLDESGMGFFGTMASANSSSSESEPKKSSYGWEPSENSSSSSSNSYSSSEGSEATEKIFRLQRKIDNLVERIELLERKMQRGE